MIKKSAKLLPLFLCFNFWVQAQVNTSTKIIAGIEVGAKGVKMSILERSLTDNNNFKLISDSSINSDFISFNASSYDATLQAFTGFYFYAKNNKKILPDDIATVISSGVKIIAEKEKKNDYIQKLISDFRIKIDEPTRNVEVISVLKESILSHFGIVSDENRFTTFLIDIGSGNTKGGYYNKKDSQFVVFQIPIGTKSTANVNEKKCGTGCDFIHFNNTINAVVDSIESADIVYAVNASGAYPATNTMAISGGIAWAVATLLHPEKAETPSLEVSYKEVVRFRENLIKYYLVIPDTSKITIPGMSAPDLFKIKKEVKKILNVFDVKSLLAGSTLMLRIMRQFEPVNGNKKFSLIKNGQVGWITGYILGKGKL